MARSGIRASGLQRPLASSASRSSNGPRAWTRRRWSCTWPGHKACWPGEWLRPPRTAMGGRKKTARQVRSWHPPPAGLLTISWNLRAHSWLSRPLRARMHVEADGQTLSPTAVPPRTGTGRACRLLRRWAGDRGGRSRGRMGQGGHRRLPVLGALRSARAEGDGRARLVCGCGAWGRRTLGNVGSVGRSYLGRRGACPQLPVGGGLCCRWCCLALLIGGRARLIGAA